MIFMVNDAGKGCGPIYSLVVEVRVGVLSMG
jgi:hypothetical protein